MTLGPPVSDRAGDGWRQFELIVDADTDSG